jgi:beta-glucosidase
VAAAAPRTVVVLSHGGIVSLEGWHDEVDAILDGLLLGQAGGGALADLLFGVENPSGHLAETIPLRLRHTPAYLNFPGEQGHVRYGEGVMVGYRHYVSVDAPVRYPFGHGLSYTTFETSDFTVRVRDAAHPLVDVELTVTNTGRRPGRHLVQLYVATQAGPVRRPARELRAFTQVELEPGESRTVTLNLDRRAFAYYDVVRGDWAVAAGAYTIQLGRSATEIEAEEIVELAGESVALELRPESTVAEWVTHPVAGPWLIDRLMAGVASAQPGGDGADTGSAMEEAFAMIGTMPMRQFARFLPLQITLETLKKEAARANAGAG